MARVLTDRSEKMRWRLTSPRKGKGRGGDLSPREYFINISGKYMLSI
jgi:hypothetical protein